MFHKFPQGMNGGTRDHHHQAREIAEDHTLPLGQIGAKEGAKQILVSAMAPLMSFSRSTGL